MSPTTLTAFVFCDMKQAMRQQPARPRASVRRGMVLLALLIAGSSVTSCGQPDRGDPTRKAGPGPRPVVIPMEHQFGDYDSDDTAYRGELGHSDGDGDDRGKATDHDNDFDGGPGYYDPDDASVLRLGRPADPNARRGVTALLERYYQAAAADDGAKACAMIYRPLARTLPSDLATQGPIYLHGARTCAAVTTKLFMQSHAQINAYSTRLKVARVRLKGSRAIAVLRFKGLAARQIELMREGSNWRLDALLDNELP